VSSAPPILLRGGPRNRWAYTAKSWDEVRSSVRIRKDRGQAVVDGDVLEYRETRDVAELPTGDTAVVWRWPK
jgi:hypothetical protein